MKRRTAKGEMVDFDLIRAKSQMVKKEKPKEVSIRQEMIDRRLRKKAAKNNPSIVNTPAKDEPLQEVIEDDNDGNDTEIDNDITHQPQPQKQTRRRQKTKQDDTGDTND